MERSKFIESCGGPMLDWAGLARLLPGVSVRGIKALVSRDTKMRQLLEPHKKPIGRKVFFRTEGVGEALGLISCEAENEGRQPCQSS